MNNNTYNGSQEYQTFDCRFLCKEDKIHERRINNFSTDIELCGKGIGTLGRDSPAQLNIVLKAVKEKIPEEYIMRFALPEISAMQMEKAIEIYKLRDKGEKKHRFK